MSLVLPQSFCAREALEVACDLLGMHLSLGAVTLRITEVEAYRAHGDTANHCRAGKTPRNAPMWGPPGHAYVYLCYGLHHMLNIVTDADGEGAAVLVRACEVVQGLSDVQARRGGKSGPVLLTGPGKVAQALSVDTSFSGQPLFRHVGLTLCEGPRPSRLLSGPRVGIDFAEPGDRQAPWRVAVADTRWVSQRAALREVGSVREFLREQAPAVRDRALAVRSLRPRSAKRP